MTYNARLMSNILANLNPEQHQAVTLPAQSALILAGAGSGKTRVLTTRIAWLIQTGQALPADILAVTFTNKAAKEMLLRLSTTLPINTRTMWIGTFHGLCNRMLRIHHVDVGLPATFQILDMQDQLAALKRLLRSMNIDEERYPPKALQSFINSAKEQGLRAGDVQTTSHSTQTFAQLYVEYQTQCQREGVVDFAELLLRSYELLRQHTAIRQHYQQRFRHVLVDEFQDTNRLQYAWLKLLSGYGEPHAAAVLAVGDDDQSIYAFRGADVENMRQFEQQFHPIVVKLEQNYRSHGHILDAANHLIAHNSERLGKNLRTEAPHGEPLRVYQADNDSQEAAWLVSEITDLISQGHARNEIAILYRSNAQSRVIEHALFSAGIPYRVYGGLRFFERAEIKHALAYLRLLENSDDDTSFIRVVNFPTRGIGARSLETLQALAQQYDCSLARAVAYMPGGKAASALVSFIHLLTQIREQTKDLSLADTVTQVVKQSGLLSHYQNEREGQERVDNLDELTNAANAFIFTEDEEENVSAPSDVTDGAIKNNLVPKISVSAIQNIATKKRSALIAFLTHAALEAGDHQTRVDQDAVQMMTVHAAKGLEFYAVFITGLEEGLFPHENSIHEAHGLEEERRLMYVAITRARARLYLSFTQTRVLHGQMRYNLRSRFFDELPENTLQWLTPSVNVASPQQSGTARNYSKPAWPNRSLKNHASRTNDAYQTMPRSAPPFARQVNTEEGQRYQVGQQVFHNKFGEGSIIAIEGNHDDARAQIRFKRHGIKWLALAVAKLEPIT